MSAKITNSTSMWLKFFKGASIPPEFCTKYALVFDENRMKMDMLMDINKECLRDMGITAMGDIIAILKHARKIHEETKEQAVETNKTSQSPVPANNNETQQKVTQPSTSKTTSTVQKSSLIGKAETSKPIPTTATAKSIVSSVVKSSIVSRSSPQTTKQSVVRVVSSKTTAPVEEKVKSSISDTSKIIVLNKRAGSETPLKEEVPFQKKIRVLPEHEGKYTIKMPEGTTPRTQKLKSRLGPNVSELQSSSTAEKKPNSVFERLGDSRVSSSTEVKQQTSTLKSRQEIPSLSDANDSSPKGTAPSVFDRLGDRNKKVIQNDALQSKALIKTKFEVRQDVKDKEKAPSKPAYDSKKAYITEKTLTTIHSNLYEPSDRLSLSRPISTRLKSEISTPTPSSSTSSSSSSSSSRLISTKSSSASSSNYSHSLQPQKKRSPSYSSSVLKTRVEEAKIKRVSVNDDSRHVSRRDEEDRIKRLSVNDYSQHVHQEVIRIARPREEMDSFTPDNKIKNLMKSMGWSEGLGLGKHNHGIKRPIDGGKARSGGIERNSTRNETVVRFRGIQDSDDSKYRSSYSSQDFPGRGRKDEPFDGQVLRTERVPSSKNKGKFIVKKYVYKKKVPKTQTISNQDFDDLPDFDDEDIEDPLAACYD